MGTGTRLDSLSEHVQKLDTSVTSVNVQSTEVKTRLTTLEDKFAEMENKFGDRLEGMKNGFKEMENQLLQMKDLDSEMGNMQQNVMKEKILVVIKRVQQSRAVVWKTQNDPMNMHILWLVDMEMIENR